MSAEHPRPGESPFKPTPPFSAFFLPALLHGFVRALIVTVVAAALIALVRILKGNNPDVVGLASGAMIWALFLFPLFGGFKLLSYSRPLQDKAFTIAGLGATFFGLGMLIVFFVGIFQDVALWFRYIPRLVEKQNQETLQAREDLKNVEAVLIKEKARLEEEYKGAREAARADLLSELRRAAKKDAAIAALLQKIEKAEAAKEQYQKNLDAALTEYRAALKESVKDLQAALAIKAKDYTAALDALLKALPAGNPAASSLRKVRAGMTGGGEAYAGFAKFIEAYDVLEAIAYDTDAAPLREQVAKAITALIHLKHLNEQKIGDGGVYTIEKNYQEALTAAPTEHLKKKLGAIRGLQEEYDGIGGIFRTKKGHDEALTLIFRTKKGYDEAVAAAKQDPDKKKGSSVERAFLDLSFLYGGFMPAPEPGEDPPAPGYEGFRGVFDTQLADFQQNYVERKTVADLPLRDSSPLAVLGHFLFETPSNSPQNAGIWPALLGSVWIALITILFAVPVGVGAALYLEEYKTSGWLGRVIQVNINNLAGVPSVVYSILGAFVFVDLIFRPISLGEPSISPRNIIGGGLTLGLLTLPVVIVAAQEAIRAVPNSIRQGAYALGATRWQVIWRQVLPLARPGILTGTILAVSRALGEAAPLVLFGALQFVDIIPSPLSGFTVLPMQIYNWAERPHVDVPGEVDKLPVWHYNAALASLVLLTLLLCLNAMAIYLRNRAQKRMRV